ncbi:hypothetical protein [Ancylobacter sp. TS-1]|uniref:hypothetical protein n=1 Tax=Ancylobacter sp. TS-1 TaxID=1850374 RepID=UPI001265D578|nr:hypothetical protein [Ancylobacter sp. TS-1]QFR34460.1 hypothetical protein GBB76_15820 [Ancylobacter sp. TS-1]
MSPSPNPVAHDHLPFFITSPGSTDWLLLVMAFTLVAAALLAGVFFLHIHSLPERLAHKGQKLQFEIVAVMCLLALFTHAHLLWVAALLLAFIDLPDFLSPMNRIARASEKLAGLPSPEPAQEDASARGEHGHA